MQQFISKCCILAYITYIGDFFCYFREFLIFLKIYSEMCCQKCLSVLAHYPGVTILYWKIPRPYRPGRYTGNAV